MFHWICPECGREIAPTVRECAACDPNAALAEPALVGVVEAPTAQTIQQTAEPPRQVRRISVPSPAAAKPKPVKSLPALDDDLPQFGGAFGDKWSGSDPLAELSAMLDTRSGEPEPPRPHKNLPITVPAVPPALRAFIADLGPATRRPANPALELAQLRPEPEPPLGSKQAFGPLKPVWLASPAVGAKLLPLTGPALQPAAPSTPRPGPAPDVAGLAHYDPLAGRPMRPAVPARDVMVNGCAPRTTLPGPMLTSRLVNFEDRELNPIPTSAVRALIKKGRVPGWLISGLIIATILVAGFNTVFSIVPRSGSEAKAAAPPPAEVPAPVAQSTSAANPLAKAIEITGFRIQVDPAKKSEIQYLVVNHTASRLAGVMVAVTLRGADALPGDSPLGRFQFVAPNLGPYESKEMSSAIERITRPVALPEWQDLRADIEIAQ